MSPLGRDATRATDAAADRPAATDGGASPRRGIGPFVAFGLLVAVVLAAGISRWASSEPDGLERVAADHGFATDERPSPVADGPLAGYRTPWVEDPGWSVGGAGLVGVGLTFALAGGLVVVARRRSSDDAGTPRSTTPPAPSTGGDPTTDDPTRPSSTTPARGARLDLATADPAAKVAALVVFVLAVVATPPPASVAFAVAAGLVAVAATTAHLPIRVLARRLTVEVPFLAFAVALPFLGADPLVEVGPLSLSQPGLWAAWGIVVKATLSASAAVVLAWTTPVADLLVGLERLRVPRALVAIAGFMARYLAVVGGELHRLQVARTSRGDDPRWLGQGKAVAATAGTMFVRSYERGERVAQAMAARGFTGTMPPTTTASTSSAPTASRWPILLWPLPMVAAAAIARLVVG